MTKNQSTTMDKPIYTVPKYIACYLIWLLIAAIGLWLVLQMTENLIDIGFAMRLNPWQLRGLENWGLFVLGVIWLLFIMIAEGMMRRSIAKHQLMNVSIRLLSIEAVVVALSYIGQYLLR
ncbi:MAG: hypothetical protein AAF639_41825 [Chloroflexota bacterium]